MAIESTGPGARSRRAVLVGALAATAASLATAMGRPSPARAGVDGDVVLGAPNVATTETKITNSTTAANVLKVVSTGSGIGIIATTVSDSGVDASSDSFVGVYGRSSTGWGVVGTTFSTTRPAVQGFAVGHTPGVIGISGNSGLWPLPPLRTGVYGGADQDDTSVGVRGDSPAGTGLVGFSGTGTPSSRPKTGVYGQANHGATGIGVRGHSGTGTGGYFSSTSGISLRATGRVRLDKCAGVATILAGTNAITVTPGVDLVATSAVVATLQGNPAGTTTVKSVAMNTTANTFRIYLTGNAAADTKVAWHVFG